MDVSRLTRENQRRNPDLCSPLLPSEGKTFAIFEDPF